MFTADRVIELLMLDDVAAVAEQERGDRAHDARSLRAAQGQDERARHRRLLDIVSSTFSALR
jgi:hypothetical protein